MKLHNTNPINFDSLKIFNMAQEINEWAVKNDWGNDWVIGPICSKNGYDLILKENLELKTKLKKLKCILDEL